MYVDIKSIAFTQDGSHLALHKNERVEIWNVSTSKLRTTILPADIGSRISSVTVVQALSAIIIGGAGIAALFDLDGNELQRFYHPRTKIDPINGQRDYWIISACVSYEDDLLITGSYQKIFVWEMDTCHLKFELSYKFPKSRGWNYDYHTVHHLALFSGNRFLLSAGMFGDTFLWDFQERKLLHDLLYLKDWKLLPEYGDAGYQDVSTLRLPNEKYVLLCVDYLYVVHLATGTTFGAIDTPNLEWRTYNAKISIDGKYTCACW